MSGEDDWEVVPGFPFLSEGVEGVVYRLNIPDAALARVKGTGADQVSQCVLPDGKVITGGFSSARSASAVDVVEALSAVVDHYRQDGNMRLVGSRTLTVPGALGAWMYLLVADEDQIRRSRVVAGAEVGSRVVPTLQIQWDDLPAVQSGLDVVDGVLSAWSVQVRDA